MGRNKHQVEVERLAARATANGRKDERMVRRARELRILTLQTQLDKHDLALAELMGFGDEEISPADAQNKKKIEHAITQLKAELAK
jgi:hypothetical protein